ncbi:DUF916 and DUF3324 domain-containing protein [Enterococcus ureasiticus]|nr:DUF916 and DUF3324 domain-containing protein [Enterococcus sp. DIV0849a]MBO0475382.1 DUF916 and DUF3324 domain-containing protein [Enterococcus ureasiticus]
MRLLFITIACFITTLIGCETALAVPEDNNLGYVVQLVQPKSQIDPNQSYFYVQTEPGVEQELEVRIKSTKKESVKIKISAADAFTGDNGTIEYTADKKKLDESLKNPISSLIKIDTPEITIGNYEEKKVTVRLNPSEEHYKGIKMGALVFKLDLGEQSSGVATEFSYRTGFLMSESGDEFTDGQTLEMTSVKASIKRGKKMVLASLRNPEPKVLEDMDITATMVKQGTDDVVKQKTVQNYSMAPNSHFDFEMDWGIDSLPSGTYTLKLDAKNANKEWHLSENFTITNKEAKEMNEQSAFKIVTPTWIKVMSITMAILTVMLAIIIIVRRKKWEKLWKKMRLKKKKKKKKKKI